jgi:hypothetical protein
MVEQGLNGVVLCTELLARSRSEPVGIRVRVRI